LAFEVREHDLAGRVGRLKTRSGMIETPALLPVINPRVQPIAPREMREKFKLKAVITNAYILMKNFSEHVIKEGVHRFLDFDGVVMTDSGAYQLLVYGEIDATPREVVEFQERIGSDIATILDVPTGWNVSRRRAEETVETTIKRAEELFQYKSREDVLWVGPIQGGLYLDLVEESARRMSALPFQIYALGSPTALMENYLFTDLVDMIVSARRHIPESLPFHLFGAAHPLMLALAVALGCDLFDSAAYAIFARGGRYMTDWGTVRIEDLRWLPCSCPVCAESTPRELLELPEDERFKALARHNLYMCLAEIKRIRQSIREGRLWEHSEVKARSHPSLLSALKRLKRYVRYLEERSPVTKRRGLFFFDSSGLFRPEVYRYKERLFERFRLEGKKVLILLPKPSSKQFFTSHEYRELKNLASKVLGGEAESIHICLYDAPFGVIPIELEGTYPLAQYVTAKPLDRETVDFVVDIIERYLRENDYKVALLVESDGELKERLAEVFEEVCKRKGVFYERLTNDEFWGRENLKRIFKAINEKLKRA